MKNFIVLILKKSMAFVGYKTQSSSSLCDCAWCCAAVKIVNLGKFRLILGNLGYFWLIWDDYRCFGGHFC